MESMSYKCKLKRSKMQTLSASGMA